jgi:hypothetical protein
VRNDVESDLLGELHRGVAVADEDVARLLEQFVHALLAGARDRLVGRHDDPLDPGGIVERLQRDDHLRGRAVGIGDDILARIARDRLRINLRHDQRNVRIHAVERAVVDDDAARRRADRSVDPADVGAGGEQRHVPAREIEMLDILDLEFLAAVAEIDDRSARARAGDRRDFVCGKLALGEDIEDFATDIAGRADDDDAIAHDIFSDMPPPIWDTIGLV